VQKVLQQARLAHWGRLLEERPPTIEDKNALKKLKSAQSASTCKAGTLGPLAQERPLTMRTRVPSRKK